MARMDLIINFFFLQISVTFKVVKGLGEWRREGRGQKMGGDKTKREIFFNMPFSFRQIPGSAHIHLSALIENTAPSADPN